ncbi:MAG TPA: hydrogen gas-evolving membrane-bound hydrogenase subunit E [Limnochordia bacterium]|jgi:multisubunit Na+/H+ antiporter MnhB subunit|nr:hydrogen gas-evolving membrane-bound hydrogenase subunit E [Limnochordia bacterium]
MMKTILEVVTLVLIGVLLVMVVREMPTFGDPTNPVHNEVSEFYLDNTQEEAGVQNVVAAIITDYRGFDTLGELTVLLTAIAGLLAVLRS